jgi:soluble cytochrome b562
MNVSSSTSGMSAADFQAGKNRFEQGMNNLSKALDKGDISAAKSSFESLKPRNAPAGAPPQDVGDNPIAKAASSLSSALDKGDLSSAKEAFSTLKNEMANVRSSGRMPGPPPGEMSETAENSSAGTTETLGNAINTLA